MDKYKFNLSKVMKSLKVWVHNNKKKKKKKKKKLTLKSKYKEYKKQNKTQKNLMSSIYKCSLKNNNNNKKEEFLLISDFQYNFWMRDRHQVFCFVFLYDSSLKMTWWTH